MAAQPMSGIYEIVNLVNGKRYVGSAVNFEQRWRQHRCELGKGRHNPIFQAAWRKYGEQRFEFRVIEIVDDKASLIEREQFYLDQMRPAYNCAPIAGSRLGTTISEASRARMGAASKRIWSDPEHRKRMSEAHKGRPLPPEQRAKISAANQGRKMSPEATAKIAANNAARNQSAEHRALISAYWKGRPKTPESIAKMAEAKRGRPAHNKGKPASAEQKAKQSAAIKAKYDNNPELRQMAREKALAFYARQKSIA